MFYRKMITLVPLFAMLIGSMAMGHTIANKGQRADLVLMPKFLGILVFDQANKGAKEAHSELKNPGKLLFLGPTPVSAPGVGLT